MGCPSGKYRLYGHLEPNVRGCCRGSAPPSVGRRETDALAAGKEYVDTGEQHD